MSETSGGLPLMAQTQNSRYLTFNELAWAVNVLQTGVLDRDLTAPPGSPSEGDAYIVDSPATGAWAGHENDIAFFFGGVWGFLGPELAQGNGIYVADEGVRVRWDASGSPIGYQVITEGGATGAAVTQTGEMMSGFISSPSNKDYRIVVKAAHGGTITETTTISASGTCTATFKINTTALGGTANSVSSSEQSQAHASNNIFSAGDDVVITISGNSSCADMSFTIKYTRTLES